MAYETSDQHHGNLIGGTTNIRAVNAFGYLIQASGVWNLAFMVAGFSFKEVSTARFFVEGTGMESGLSSLLRMSMPLSLVVIVCFEKSSFHGGGKVECLIHFLGVLNLAFLVASSSFEDSIGRLLI